MCTWFLHLGPDGNYSVYLLCGAIIQTRDSIKDLGVVMDHELTFHEHTSIVIITAKVYCIAIYRYT